MGGNAGYIQSNGEYGFAEKINFTAIPRKDFVRSFGLLFNELDKHFNYNLFFSSYQSSLVGSSVHVFDTSIADEDFIRIKNSIGDIDIFVQREMNGKLFSYLESKKNEDLINTLRETIIYKGSKHLEDPDEQTFNKLCCIFKYINKDFNIIKNVQVDFEFIEKKDIAFRRFSNGSSLEDLKQNIKGVFHKYLLMSLANTLGEKEDIVLSTEKATKEDILKGIPHSNKNAKVSKGIRIHQDGTTQKKSIFYFNVGRGLVIRLEPLNIKDPISGKEVYKIKEEYTFEKNVRKIFETLFPNADYDYDKFASFTGLLDLIVKWHLDLKEKIAQNFFDLCFSTSKGYDNHAQYLERTSKELDNINKSIAFDLILKAFNMRMKHSWKEEKEEYYKNYTENSMQGYDNNSLRLTECITVSGSGAESATPQHIIGTAKQNKAINKKVIDAYEEAISIPLTIDDYKKMRRKKKN